MESLNIALVAVDLDGTLVRGDGVAREDVSALAQAIENGVIVCIATGRPDKSARMVLEQIGLGDLPIISFNGAMVKVPGTDEPLLHLTMPLELAREVVSTAVQERWHLHYFIGDDCYVSRMSKMAWVYWRRTGIRPIPVGDLRKVATREPTKIILVEEPERVNQIGPEMMRRWGDKLYVARSRPDIVEIVNPSVNKGMALVKLSEHLGIPIAKTLALGDATNDAPLIEAAGIGVAMPDSDPEVMALADVILEDSEAPVADAIRQLVLRGS
ncbi:MAG: Cof-type HAD-IIB family hydrolase [Armatimonadota bacterium]